MNIKISINISGLGNAIKEKREAKGMSQSDLANKIERSAARISELENEAEGKSTISIDTLYLLEAYLGIDLFSNLALMRAVIDVCEAAQKDAKESLEDDKNRS